MSWLHMYFPPTLFVRCFLILKLLPVEMHIYSNVFRFICLFKFGETSGDAWQHLDALEGFNIEINVQVN